MPVRFEPRRLLWKIHLKIISQTKFLLWKSKAFFSFQDIKPNFLAKLQWQQEIKWWADSIASWFRLCLPSCSPGFKSKAHHQPKDCWNWNCNCYWNQNRAKINEKEASISSYFHKIENKMSQDPVAASLQKMTQKTFFSFSLLLLLLLLLSLSGMIYGEEGFHYPRSALQYQILVRQKWGGWDQCNQMILLNFSNL